MGLLFSPGKTVNIVATAGASISVALATGSGKSVRIKNVSATNVAFVAVGTAAVTASVTASMPIGLGETVGITRAPDTQLYVAAIVGSDTATVYFTIGDGE